MEWKLGGQSASALVKTQLVLRLDDHLEGDEEKQQN